VQSRDTPRSRRAEQAAADRQRTAPGNSAESTEAAEGFEDGVLTERSARIAAAHRLLRKPRRAETGEFLAEGAQAVAEAVAAERREPGTVRELYITAGAGSRHVDLVRAAFAAHIEVTQVTDRAAAALSDTVSPQGVVARCTVPVGDVGSIIAAEPRLIAVLVETNDPGNAGTIIRLADAAGADAVIFAGESVDPYNPKAVRASTGSLFHLPVARATDVGELLMQLAEAGLSVLATTGVAAGTDLDTAIDDGILDLPTAWLFGSEAHGLPAEVLAAADESVKVPIYGAAESLNLATAAAICLYASARAHRADRADGTAPGGA
jgi:TrmH family RNA methyltransferase